MLNVLNCDNLELMTGDKSGPAGDHCRNLLMLMHTCNHGNTDAGQQGYLLWLKLFKLPSLYRLCVDPQSEAQNHFCASRVSAGHYSQHAADLQSDVNNADSQVFLCELSETETLQKLLHKLLFDFHTWVLMTPKLSNQPVTCQSAQLPVYSSWFVSGATTWTKVQVWTQPENTVSLSVAKTDFKWTEIDDVSPVWPCRSILISF